MLLSLFPKGGNMDSEILPSNETLLQWPFPLSLGHWPLLILFVNTFSCLVTGRCLCQLDLAIAFASCMMFFPKHNLERASFV